MKLAVFAYDFPHSKSQDILTRLWLEEHEVGLVLAAPKRALSNRVPSLRIKPRREGSMHPAALAARIGVDYVVKDHDHEDVIRLLKTHEIDLGVVAGARILPPRVIEAVPYGILNLHPGLLPEIRGLDALKWSVVRGFPPGVTAHLIDERVDAGRIVIREPIAVHPDDSLLDLSIRLADTQVRILSAAITSVARGSREDFEEVGPDYPTNTTMGVDMEAKVIELFPSWRDRLSRTQGSETR